MSYQLHIIKSEHWTESQEQPITLEEWNALIDADPELQRQDQATATSASGVSISVNDPGMVRYESEDGPVWLMYSRGGITCSGSEEAIDKLKEIADKLGAKVQGDEGELY